MFDLQAPETVKRRLAELDRDMLVEALAGLLLCPELQVNYLRLQTLLQWSMAYATGSRPPSAGDLARLLKALNGHHARLNEDPAEDVFVSSVTINQGPRRIFNGIHDGADFHLQRVLDAIAMVGPPLQPLLRAAYALLILSEEVAARCDYAPGLMEHSVPGAPIVPSLPRLSCPCGPGSTR